MKKGLFVLMFTMLTVSFAFAETVVKFKDGNEVTYGSVERQGDQYCTYKSAGLFCFSAEDVVSVKEVNETTPTDANVVYGTTIRDTNSTNSGGGFDEAAVRAECRGVSSVNGEAGAETGASKECEKRLRGNYESKKKMDAMNVDWSKCPPFMRERDDCNVIGPNKDGGYIAIPSDRARR